MARAVGDVEVPAIRIDCDVTWTDGSVKRSDHALGSWIDNDDFGIALAGHVNVTTAPRLDSQRVKTADISRKIHVPNRPPQIVLIH